MKFSKEIDGKEVIIECKEENLYSLCERNGYKPVEEVDEVDIELEELRDHAKELGIKNAHMMKKETLIDKIAALEK